MLCFSLKDLSTLGGKNIIAQDSHKISADTLLCIFRWILTNVVVKEKGLSRTPLHLKLISPFVRLEHRASKDMNVFFPETPTVLSALERGVQDGNGVKITNI